MNYRTLYENYSIEIQENITHASIFITHLLYIYDVSALIVTDRTLVMIMIITVVAITIVLIILVTVLLVEMLIATTEVTTVIVVGLITVIAVAIAVVVATIIVLVGNPYMQHLPGLLGRRPNTMHKSGRVTHAEKFL